MYVNDVKQIQSYYLKEFVSHHWHTYIRKNKIISKTIAKKAKKAYNLSRKIKDFKNLILF